LLLESASKKRQAPADAFADDGLRTPDRLSDLLIGLLIEDAGLNRGALLFW
jgi:hypothetical protein